MTTFLTIIAKSFKLEKMSITNVSLDISAISRKILFRNEPLMDCEVGRSDKHNARLLSVKESNFAFINLMII